MQITIIVSGVLIVLSLLVQLLKIPPQKKNIILMCFVIIIGAMSTYSELKSNNASIGIHPAKFSTPPTLKAPSWNNYQNLYSLNLPKGFTYLLLYGTKSQGKSTFAKQIVKQAIDSSQPALYVDIISPIKSVQEGLEQIFGSPTLSSITQLLQQYNANKQIPLLIMDHIERGITSECYLCNSIYFTLQTYLVFTLLHEVTQLKIIMISDQVSLAQTILQGKIQQFIFDQGKYANSMIELAQYQLPIITQGIEILNQKINEFEPLNQYFKFDWVQNTIKQNLTYPEYLLQEKDNLIKIWKEDSGIASIIKNVFDIMCSFQKEKQCENQFIHFGLIKKIPDFDLNIFYRCLDENWIFSYQGQLRFFDNFIFEAVKNF